MKKEAERKRRPGPRCRRRRTRRSLVGSLSALAATCFAWLCGCSSSLQPPVVPLSEPAALCGGDVSPPACNASEQVEAWLTDPELLIVQSQPTPSGIQGARVLTLSVPRDIGPHFLRAKWRANSTATAHSAPRRELAAYEIQKLFLEPDEYVVPPTRAHCFPMSHYRILVDPDAQASTPEMDCVFGYLSYWLEDALPSSEVDASWFDPDRGALDVELFHRRPGYRRAVANVNLLTYLIDHDDTHPGQFLMRPTRMRPIVYSIDNSMSFAAGTNPNLGRLDDWSRIQMPLQSDQLKRLGGLRPEDLFRLRVVQMFELQNRQLVQAEGKSETEEPARKPLRWRDGQLLVGLHEAELEQLWSRLQLLLDRAEQGRILVKD